MKKFNKTLIAIAGALVVIGAVIYGSTGLYSKLNKVDELNGRLEEAAEIDSGQEAVESTEQAPETEPVQSPELVPSTHAEEVSESTAAPSAALTPGPASDNVENGQKPMEDSRPAEDKARKKQEIDAAIMIEMQQLRSSCQASSDSLVQQIMQELGQNDEATLAAIQSKFLSRIFAEESDCDAKFNQLLGKAQSEYNAAGLSGQSMSNWISQYEGAKAQARAAALTAITNVKN